MLQLFHRNVSNLLRKPSSRIEGIRNLNLSLELPEKYKGTRVEKWYIYWKGLLQDYKDVGKDTMKDIRLKPLKALTIFSGLGFAGYCVSNNPDEQNFRDQVLSYSNDVLLVGESTRSEEAVSHLKYIENFENCGVVRRLSLGLFSIMWFDNYDKACGIYEAQCSYTKPSYLKFYERIIDVGFLNHWWIIDSKMKDFDVKESDWIKMDS